MLKRKAFWRKRRCQKWCQSNKICSGTELFFSGRVTSSLLTNKKTKARKAGFIRENDDVNTYRSQGQRPHPTLDDVLQVAQL
jgi:hypothetical protein